MFQEPQYGVRCLTAPRPRPGIYGLFPPTLLALLYLLLKCSTHKHRLDRHLTVSASLDMHHYSFKKGAGLTWRMTVKQANQQMAAVWWGSSDSPVAGLLSGENLTCKVCNEADSRQENEERTLAPSLKNFACCDDGTLRGAVSKVIGRTFLMVHYQTEFWKYFRKWVCLSKLSACFPVNWYDKAHSKGISMDTSSYHGYSTRFCRGMERQPDQEIK